MKVFALGALLTSAFQALFVAASGRRFEFGLHAVLLAASASRALAATVERATVPNPDGCWGDGFGFANSSARFVPLSQAIECMKSMTVSKSTAMQTIKAYEDMFRLSYAFYDVARDPSATLPSTIPTTWTVYGTPNEGKVNLAEKSAELMAEVEANGANGMLPLQLTGLYALPRDGHTDIGVVPPFDASLALLDMSLSKEGATIPDERFYLSLSRGEDGAVRPVYKYEDADGIVVREQVIDRIDGEGGLEAMVKLLSNVGMGFNVAQFHSVGARMNGFLMDTVIQGPGTEAPGVLWISDMNYDVSSLPECLNVTFQASAETGDAAAETQWCFFAVTRSGDDFNQTVAYYDEQFATPGGPFKDYQTLFGFITAAYPAVSSYVYDEPAARRALKQAASDASATCESGGTDVFERRSEQNWTGTYSGCVEDPDQANLIAAYKMLDDGIMVFRYPGFGDINLSVDAWRNAVDFARENNATKLLFDMIKNGGGDIDTQYFMRLALYPMMTYNDWKDDYTRLISPQMLKIINYIAAGSEVISLLSEYGDEVLAALEDTNEPVDELVGSTLAVLQIMDEFLQSTGLVIGNDGGQLVNALLSSATDRFERIANGTETLTVDALVQFLSTPDAIITSQIGSYGGQKLFQGGSNVTNTGFFNLLSTPQDFLDASKKVVYDLPFESYVLLDDGVSGSSASTFEQGVRAYARKYAGEVTPLTAVSFGCLGEAATCPLTQFSGGQLGGGNGQLNAVYASVPGVFATNRVASFMNETGIVQTEGGRDILEQYINRLGPEFIEPVPEVPFLQKKMASYAYNALYPNVVSTSDNVIPMEFLNQPADAVINLWPRPGSTAALSDGESLPELYREASKYFMTREQAAAEPRLEFAPASTLDAASGDEPGNSGVARAFTAALFFLCLLVQ